MMSLIQATITLLLTGWNFLLRISTMMLTSK